MDRRDLLRFGAASAALAIARTARAHRPMPGPVFSVLAGVSAGAAAVPDASIALRPDGTREYVKLGNDVGAQLPTIFSNDNANARFTVWIEIGEPPGDTWPYLRFANILRAAATTSMQGAQHIATFDVDADTASALAHAVSTNVHQRTALDDGLRYAWYAPGDGHIGLRVSNHGKRVVRLVTGGRNRFSFRVADAVESPDAGDELRAQRLAPGEHLDLEAALRIAAPGTYDVDCELQGQLYPEHDDPSRGPDWAAEVWDIAPHGSVRVTVR
jgi:hypothetical protein